MIRVGLLGSGRIGRLHAENIASHRESTLTAVADIYDESANNLAAQFCAIVKSADEVIVDPNITRSVPNWFMTVVTIGETEDCVQLCSNIPSPDNLQLTFGSFDK